MKELQEIENWYDDHRSVYDNFSRKISELLITLIEEESIPYHSITHRVKTKESFLNKCNRKDYENPIESIMDMAGIRVIAYTTSDVDRICNLILGEFSIDEQNSGDKADLLKDDKVGYLSIHYIAKLSDERAALKEYTRYKDLVCEIQVRTLLQHAWAEIEHDRSYKFSGVLPKGIQRRFHLIAGVLEMMDGEFQRLSDEIDSYAASVREDTRLGNFDIPLDTTSLIEFISSKIINQHIEKDFHGRDNEIIDELKRFGMSSIADLCTLFTPSFCEAINKITESGNFLGILRSAMICNNTEHYFKNAWTHSWIIYGPSDLKFWSENGADVSILKQYIVMDEDAKKI